MLSAEEQKQLHDQLSEANKILLALGARISGISLFEGMTEKEKQLWSLITPLQARLREILDEVAYVEPSLYLQVDTTSSALHRTFTASVWKEDGWYIAQCLQVDVASQGQTEQEAIENLREALMLHATPPIATDLPKPSLEDIPQDHIVEVVLHAA